MGQVNQEKGRGGGSESRRPGVSQVVAQWMDHAVSAVVPLSVTAELTQACNLACLHCFLQERIGGTSPQVAEMPISRWVDLMSELAAAGTAMVGVTGGEVAARDGWLDVAEAVAANRMILSVLTNATLLTDSDIARLIELRPARVAVSLYGADARTHEAVTGVPGSFTRSCEVIRTLVSRGVTCRISTVLFRDGVAEVAKTRRLSDDLGCEFACNPTVYPTIDGVCDISDLMPRKADVKGYYRLMLESVPDAKSRVTQDDEVAPTAVHNCRAGISGAYIQADGTVMPCPGFLPGFGSVAQSDFVSVWQGEAAARHREAMAQPLKACDECDICGFCVSRCPKVVSLASGSLDGPDELACRTARALVELRAERQAASRRC